MIADTVQKATSAVAHLSYENWLSIVLSALAVLLAIATLIVAIAGIAIAIVGLWGLRAMKKAAEQRAHEAVQQAIGEYPDAAQFINIHQQMRDLHKVMQRQISAFKAEFEMLHQKSEAASEILDRLSTRKPGGASNGNGDSADKVVEPMTSTYPGEEADPDDGNNGESPKDEGADSAHPR